MKSSIAPFLRGIVCLLLIGSASLALRAQTTMFYNNNTKFNVCNDVIVAVHGDVKVNSKMDDRSIAFTSSVGVQPGRFIIFGNVINEGSAEMFQKGDQGRVELKGQVQQLVKGTGGNVNFHKVDLDNQAGIKLEIDASFSDTFTLQKGDVNLNGKTLFLLPEINNKQKVNWIGDAKADPQLFNDDYIMNRRVFGASGKIGLDSATVDGGYFDSLKDPFNMGAIKAPGMTSLEFFRHHYPQDFLGTGSIHRFYDIRSKNTVMDGIHQFSFIPTVDLNGIDQNKLNYFHVDVNGSGSIGSDVQNEGKPTQTPNSANFLVYAEQDTISPFTGRRHALVPCENPTFDIEGFTSSAPAIQTGQIRACAGDLVTLQIANVDYKYNPGIVKWSNGDVGDQATITAPVPDTITVSVFVQNDRKCFTQDSIEIIWESFPTVNFLPDQDSSVCFDKKLVLFPDYGLLDTSLLTFLWDDGSTNSTNTITGLDQFVTKDYRIIVVKGPGCKDTADIKVHHYELPDVDLGMDETICGNASHILDGGDFTSYPTYNNEPVVYNWYDAFNSGTGNSRMYTANSIGAHHITLTVSAKVTADNHVCKAADSINVFLSDPKIDLPIIKQDVTCHGDMDGALSISNIQTGIGIFPTGYSFNWNGPNGFSSTDESLTGLGSGDYSVTVTDSVGCTDEVLVINVFEPEPLHFGNVFQAQDSCLSGNGSISLIGTGGNPPFNYTYKWDVGPTTPGLTGLSPGIYKVTVTDPKSCTQDTIINIIGPPAVLSIKMDTSSITCFGANDGQVSVLPSGGTPPFTYKWEKNFNSFSQTTAQINGLGPGQYDVTVTDNWNCTTTGSRTLVEPQEIQITLNSKTDVTCFGGTNGAIDISIVSNAPYSILWSNGANTEDITNLPKGTYEVTVTYNNNPACTKVQMFTIDEPLEITRDQQQTIVKDDWCLDSKGAISVVITGGTAIAAPAAPYIYNWENSMGASIGSSSGLIDISKGTYTLFVTDANSCMKDFTFLVDGPADTLELITTSTDLSCPGIDDGVIVADVLGGNRKSSPPFYTFNWAGPTPVITTNSQPNNLSPGIYDLTVTDDKGCTVIGKDTINDLQPINIVLDSIVDVICNGQTTGKIFTTITGAMPLTIEWSDGQIVDDPVGLAAGKYDVSVTYNNNQSCVTSLKDLEVKESNPLTTNPQITDDGCNNNSGSIILNTSGGTAPLMHSWSNGATTQDITSLSAGNYTVNITDASNCTFSQTLSVSSPAPLAVNSLITEITCNGNADGAIQLTVTGGNQPYTYAWSHDANLTTVKADNLMPGTYTTTVTDATNCTQMGTFTIGNPALLQIQLDLKKDISCFGTNDGALQIRGIGGGVSNYQIIWSTGATTGTISNLAAGNYKVTVTGNAGCTSTGDYDIIEPTELKVAPQVTNDLCFDQNGKIITNPTGGTTPYQFMWNNSATTQDLQNIAPGTYSFTVTDANNCMVSRTGLGVDGPLAPMAIMAVKSDISCNGNTDGGITITTTGGNSPFTYKWSHDASLTTATANNLSQGTYIVTATDGRNCSKIETIILSEPAPIVIQQDQLTNVSCAMAGDGNITISATGGGVSNYSVSWSNGQTGLDATNLSAGTFTATVTASAGCFETRTFTITEPTVATISTTVVDDDCVVGAGVIDLNVMGGTPPFTYNWSNQSTTQDVSNLIKGAYDVTITDNNNCVFQANATVDGANNPIQITGNAMDVSCFGQSDGSISISVTGGSPNYTTIWSNSITSSNLVNLTSGVYSVEVIDNKNCRKTESFTISESNRLTISETITHTTAIGSSDGAISLAVSGGRMPYQFLWGGNQTTADIINLTAGNYSVTVTDASGCSEILNYRVQYPSVVQISEVIKNESCAGANDGAIDLTITGGMSPYTFLWSQTATTEDLTNLAPGLYHVTVTDQAGNQQLNTYTILDAVKLNVNTAVTLVDCAGASTGEIILNASGGTAPINYSWSTGATTSQLTMLMAGNYDYTVTDANNCSENGSVPLTDPAGMTLSITKMDATGFGKFDGSADLTVMGGNLPLRFNWSNGNAAEDLTQVNAGTYMVTVTDAKGCQKTESITIDQPTQLMATAQTTDISCFGQTDGAIDLMVTGGVTPYTFAWSNSTTTEDLSGLSKGSYLVTVTDTNGNKADGVFQINEPAEIQIVGVSKNVKCNNGSDGEVTLNITGGTAPISYNWSNGDSNQNLTGVKAGTYNVTATDSRSCIKSVGPFVITEPIALTLNVISTNATGFAVADGSIDLSVSGGSPPYTFSWSGGQASEDLSNISAGTYSVTVSDVNQICSILDNITITEPAQIVITDQVTNISCNGLMDGSVDISVTGGVVPYTFLWSNNATTEDVSGLSAGSYMVTVTDQNNNKGNHTVIITEPVIIQLQLSETNISCNGVTDGRVDLTATGGTPPFTFAWSNGDTSEDLTGLGAGSYSVEVTDSRGCKLSSNTVQITEPPMLNLSFTKTDVTANGATDGSINITVTGGTPPLSYSWSSGQASEDVNNLPAGTYMVTVTDSKNCSVSETMTIDQPQVMTVTFTKKDESCNGAADGEIDITVAGGVMPYTFSWSTGATTEDLNGLVAGNYMVTITDAQNATENQTFNITSPTAMLVQGTSKDIDCGGNMNGEIDLTISGGVSPYTIAWSSGQSTEDLTGLGAGNYSVTVTDANNCTKMEMFTISEPTPISIIFTKTDVTVNGGMDGAIDLTISGGTTPYTIVWSSGQSTEDLANITAGIYSVTVTDSKNCMGTEMITIDQPNNMDVTGMTTDVTCNGAADGAIDLTVMGGVAPITFNWSNGASTEDLTGLSGGNYDVTVTDTNNNSKQLSFTINESMAITINGNEVDVKCVGDMNGEIDILVNGGTSPYTFAWSNGATTEDVTGLVAGPYTVTVTDSKNCKNQESFTIDAPTDMTITGMITDVSCGGNNDGAIDLSVSGGASPYTFNWSNGQTSEDLTNLTQGMYDVTVTDNNSCSKTASFDVQGSGMLGITDNVKDITCNGDMDGEIDLNIVGGATPYTFQWSNGATSQNLTGLGSGNYEVTITDNNNCSEIETFTVKEPAPLVINENIQLSGCSGANSGAIVLSVSGGNMPYSFNWSNSATSQNVSGLSPGSFSVTVNDNKNCATNKMYQVGSTSSTFEAKFLAATPIHQNEPMVFIDVSFPIPNAWNWSFGDPASSTSSDANPTFAYPNEPGKDTSAYMAQLVASNLVCSDTVQKEIKVVNIVRIIIDNVDERKFDGADFTELNAFPVPTDDQLYFDISLSKESYMEVSLFDLAGKIHRTIKPGKHLSYLSYFNTRNLHNGVYFLNVRLNNQRQRTIKIIVQHPE